MHKKASANTLTHPGSAVDPIQALKACRSCWSVLPTSHFGLAKNRADGYNEVCKACRSERNARAWTRKFGRKYPFEAPDIVRNVTVHNETILSQVLSTSGATIWAYQPETKTDLKVVFGVGSLGMMSMAMFNLDGSQFREYNYSGVDDRPVLMVILKQLGIRLELTDVNLLAAKATIYYI